MDLKRTLILPRGLPPIRRFKPRHFTFKLNDPQDVLSKVVPSWDITILALIKAYDDARFKRYLTEDIGADANCRPVNRFFKRRIPWIFPDTGILTK